MKSIEPSDLIETLGIDGLCETADRYYDSVGLRDQQQFKPFASIEDAPLTLKFLGELLAGLELGVGMTVLDFGAGTGWLTRRLCQMGVFGVGVDPSKRALELARQFEDLELPGPLQTRARFLHYDGKRLPLDDASVDRVVCFDAFHHVPNQRDVVFEFFRVLVDGGVVGMSEPGDNHAYSEMSQYEMRKYNVLENNVDAGVLAGFAREAGFSEFWSVPVLDHAIPIRPHAQAAFRSGRPPLRALWRIFKGLEQTYRNRSVIFFRKGAPRPDSRRAHGLAHETSFVSPPRTVRSGQPISLSFRTRNVGSSTWLAANERELGVVKIGLQLRSAPDGRSDPDFSRIAIERDIAPGEESIVQSQSFVLTEPGEYILSVDLVSEHVCWLEQLGSRPETLELTVTP